MAYYDTCPYCGANLDPGEKCDCRKENGDGVENIRTRQFDCNGGNWEHIVFDLQKTELRDADCSYKAG